MSQHSPLDPALVSQMAADSELADLRRRFFNAVCKYKYSYNFSWLGRPIIQFPQDMVAMQEILWTVRPDLIVETGVAHGGSLVFHASILELIGGAGQVVGIDIDIREHNRLEIERHPLTGRIQLIEGSSIAPETVLQVEELVRSSSRPLVVLDSNHTHDHVKSELALYSPFVKQGSYLIVCDTVIEDMPPDSFPDRPWGVGDNPKTAVLEFLKSNDRFEIDRLIEDKLAISVAPSGYLRCLKD